MKNLGGVGGGWPSLGGHTGIPAGAGRAPDWTEALPVELFSYKLADRKTMHIYAILNEAPIRYESPRPYKRDSSRRSE